MPTTYTLTLTESQINLLLAILSLEEEETRDVPPDLVSPDLDVAG